ncbi:MAG: adenylyltransferase/cytidyltransferase family protein [Gammaproteobacteria bacterium]|nr:adenylyltransferase/cytidyltransferase family protein [Gammaproteobacteria bacterium]MDD9875060.1 adenylyltransferase/cytidyltransferase family protein [Gammaproteobacteria bacterium]
MYDPAAGLGLADWAARFPRPLVFTNGCFDLLHRGHIDCLERAAALGETLLVGVNSDRSVQLLDKGPGRPVNALNDRMAVLAALAVVDAVVSFDQDTPLQLIRQVRPEHLVKGGDWAPGRIVGGAEVRGWGGRVHALPFRFQRSTSALLERILGRA